MYCPPRLSGACRAGTTTRFNWGDFDVSNAANSSGIAQTCDVGQYPANPWGFFDLSGNVWEMASDSQHVRGGSWVHGGQDCRSARRAGSNIDKRDSTIGFRLAFQNTNKAPTDLNSTTVLSIAENQPAGTTVGQLIANDPEGDAISYHLVSGQGDGNNSMFIWIKMEASDLRKFLITKRAISLPCEWRRGTSTMRPSSLHSP